MEIVELGIPDHWIAGLGVVGILNYKLDGHFKLYYKHEVEEVLNNYSKYLETLIHYGYIYNRSDNIYPETDAEMEMIVEAAYDDFEKREGYRIDHIINEDIDEEYQDWWINDGIWIPDENGL